MKQEPAIINSFVPFTVGAFMVIVSRGPGDLALCGCLTGRQLATLQSLVLGGLTSSPGATSSEVFSRLDPGSTRREASAKHCRKPEPSLSVSSLVG